MRILFQQLMLFTISILLFTACSKQETIGISVEKTFWLRHKGAEMPIWVRGNTASGKMVLFLHGGPGDCALCYRDFLKGLEKEVAVAYWDQRLAGASLGKIDLKTLSYEQFGEDAFYAIKLLHEQVPNTKIYLLGHSYGVELAWQYLTIAKNQQSIAGAVLINGTHSTYSWLYYMREWVLREARLQKDSEAEQYMLKNPVTNTTVYTLDLGPYYKYMFQLNGNPVSLYDDKKFVLKYLFTSPNLAFAQFIHGKFYEDFTNKDTRYYEKGALLKNIQIPIGLFWGKKDGIVPIEVGHEMEQLLTNTSKTFVTFDKSWHEPFITETPKFTREVINFVKTH